VKVLHRAPLFTKLLPKKSHNVLTNGKFLCEKGQVAMESKYATLILDGRDPIHLPVVQGTNGDTAIDVSGLYRNWGILTCDPGYMSTGSCYSAITFIDGEQGIVRYRGYNVADLVERKVGFVETAWLLINGDLPTKEERAYFRELLTTQEILHEGMLKFFDALPPYGDPMAILAAAIQCSSLYHPDLRSIDRGIKKPS